MNHIKPVPRRTCSRLTTSMRRGAAAVAACFAVSPLFANPVNPVVVNGTASFNQVGNVLTVTNSNGAIINWDKFSIKAGETTHFAQSSASSAVLNRVLNDPSAIYGTLSSNGRVWLVNPAGILVGPGGRVDTAGFVASTLNVRNEDFLAGRKLFENTPGAANVVNQGEIRTPSGGNVYLVGSNVSNEGIILTPAGETILAAGATVSLIDSATPGVKVDITGVEGNSTNLGTIAAEAGRVGIAGVLVRNSGLINASSVVSEGGRVFLKASRDAYLDGNGRIVTTGTKGGAVEVLGNRVAVTDSAEIDASGRNGGGKILIGGDYQGKNANVQNAGYSTFGPNASLKADATEVGAGGTVIVWADDTTRAYGNISARGGSISGNGGFVETSGKRFLDFTGLRVNTDAALGRSGTWLLDPGHIDVDSIAAATISGNLASGNVVLSTDNSGDGDIIVNSAITKTAGGNNSLTLSAYRSIVLNSAIASTTGKLDLILQSHATSDAGVGSVSIFANITTNGGNLTVGGGTDPTQFAARGYGTAGNSELYGIYINGSTINAATGNVLMRGEGVGNPGPGGNDTDGIELYNSSAQIITTSGNVTLIGRAGDNATYTSAGVYVGGLVQTGSGAIDIRGTGGNGSSYENRGIKISGGTVNSTSGPITLTGYGGNSPGGYNLGVYLTSSAMVSTTGAGNISIVGYGGGTASNNIGSYVSSSSQVVANGNGNIDIVGFGSQNPAATHDNDGIYLAGAVRSNGTGTINLLGKGGGIGEFNPGVNIDGGVVESLNPSGGAVTLTGFGSATGTNTNRGVYVHDNGQVGSYGGNIAIAGTGGGTSAGDTSNYGVRIHSNAGIYAHNAANISITGTAGYGGSDSMHIGDISNANGYGTISAPSGSQLELFGYKGPIVFDGAIVYGGDLTVLSYGGGAATGNIAIGNSTVSLATGALRLVAGWGGTGTNRAASDGTDGSLTITDSMLTAGEIKLKAVDDIAIVGVSKGTWIQGTGNMEVEANSLHLTGGSAYGQNPMIMYGGAGVMLQTTSGATTQTVKIDSDIVLQAGSANNALYGGSFYGGSVALSAGGIQDISAQSIQLSGGAGGHDNSVEIISGGNQVITLYGGNLGLTGGGGVGGSNNQARIQHGQWAGGVPSPSNSGSQTITLLYGGTVSLAGGSGDGNLGYYGSECAAALGASLCRGSSNDASIENLKNAQLIDFSSGAGTLTITGGTVGDQNWAGISNQATGTTQEIRGNPVIALTGGASGGRIEVSGPDTFELSNDAGIYSKGSGMQTISASTLTINGGSGASTVGGAGISNEFGGGAGTLFIQTTGDVTLQGGASNAASPYAAAAYIANRNNGLVSLQVNGNLNVHGGGGSSAPAIIGTIEGAGNVLITTGGNINLTANSSHVAVGSNSAGYGASIIINSNNDITLTDSLTRGVRIGSLFDSLSPTSVTLSARNDITIGSASGYGAMIGVSAPTAGTATVDLYAGAHGYGGDLLLNGSARIKVGAGTVSLRAGQDAAANGRITQMAGSAIYGGQIALAAGGNLTLNGDIHSAPAGGIKAAAGVDVYGGTLNASPYGGDVFLSGDLLATAGDINLYARAGASNNAGGSITQYGGSFVAGDAVFLMAQGDLNLSGSVTSDSSQDIYAFAGVGYNAGTACSGGPCPDPMFSSAYGGNLNLAATSLLSSSGAISLAANVGTAASANGNINLLAGGQVEANGSISLVAGHNIDLHGSVDATGVATPSELMVYAGAGFSRTPSNIGGNITTSGSLFGNQLVKLVAEAGAGSGAHGGISQTGGSIQTGVGAIDIIGGADVSLGGSVAAYGGNLQVRAGLSNSAVAPTLYGGNLLISGSVSSSGSKIDLFAQSGTATGLKGTFSQTAGSVIYGGNVTAISSGNASISGAITGTSNVMINAGWDNFADALSMYGGDLLFAGTSNIQSGNWLEAYAEAGLLAATGGKVTQAGIMNAGGNISIAGDRDVAINGSVTAAGRITLWAGWSETPYYGGSLSFGTGSQVAAYGGNLEAYAVGALESHGDIIQYGGSLYASSDLILAADGNVKVYGRVEADLSLNLYAGINSFEADSNSSPFEDPGFTSAYGGNIILGSGSRLIGDHVGLYANEGSFPEGTSGHILQAAGGEINVIDGVIVTSLDVYAAGKVELNGIATVEAGEPVTIHAGFDNPNGGLAQSLPGRSVTINSLVTDGSGVSLYATGPIFANIQNASLLNANVIGASGGIEINHTGASVPTTITLIDNATTNSAVSFAHRGSTLLLNGGHSFSTAGGDIFVAAPENNLTYYGASFSGASTLLAANGNLTVANAMSVMGDLGLSAGSALDVNAIVQAGNLTLSAPTVNIVTGNVDVFGGDAIVVGSTINIGTGATRVMGANVFFGGGTLHLGGGVLASGQIEFNLANINGSVGGNFHASGATSNITGFASGNITLDNGSYFNAGNNIDLKLTGSGSTLSLLNGSYLVADTSSPPGSIFLDFTARESSGLVIAGVGSGLFIGNTSTPATESNGLHIKVAAPTGGIGTNPVINELIRATDEVTKPQNDENLPPPPPATGAAGSTQSSNNLGSGTTGADGTFGSDSGSTGGGTGGTGGSGGGTGEQTTTGTQKDEGSTSGTTTASNTKDDGSKEEKKDEKKDKKDKKSDDAKDEKKDDKPAQKKVAQCGT